MSRYLSETLRADEWEALKSRVAVTDDPTLLFMLECLWDEFECKQVGELPDIRESAAMTAEVQKTVRRQKLRLLRLKLLKIAAILLIPFLLGISAYLYQDRRQMAAVGRNEVTVKVAKGQKATVTLPDGSTACLNAESALRYRQNYGYEDRKVCLEGEAYFEVKNNPSKKFTVHTECLDIEVSGTCFNVYAYETENKVEMTLVSGQVKVEAPLAAASSRQSLEVRSNEKVIYDKTSGELRIEKADTHFCTAWMRGELVFRSECITTVLLKIERRYGVKFHIEGAELNKDRFTGYFGNEPIGDVMKILVTHYGFTYRIEGEDVWIYTKKNRSEKTYTHLKK